MSFRNRLFLLALLLVAAVISVVIGGGYLALLDHEVQRLDVRLCIEARRLASEPEQGADLRRLENDLVSKLHLEGANQLAFSAGRSSMPGQAFSGTQWARFSRAEPAWTSLASADTTLAGCAVGTWSGEEESWRLARLASGKNFAVIAADLAASRDALQRQLKGTLATIVPISLALAALVAWLLADAAIQPVTRLRQAMRQIRTSSLDRRLTDTGEDTEFRELIATYNDMLARLEASFAQASRFSADAAHELMTPLSILRGRIEEARRAEESEERQEAWGELLDETGRLIAIVRKLLLLSRADAGQLHLEREDLDLSSLLTELAADAEMARTVDLQVDVAPGLHVQADRTLLRQLLNNLITNALRYCTTPGWIRITARQQPGAVVLRFANTCAPISVAERQHLFERFFRADGSRTRSTGGSGLGLSIAREIAQAHGGTLTLDEGPDNEVSLALTLPFP